MQRHYVAVGARLQIQAGTVRAVNEFGQISQDCFLFNGDPIVGDVRYVRNTLPAILKVLI